MKREKEDKSGSLTDKLLGFDKFGKSINLRIDEGKDAYPSIVGAICSIILTIVLLAFAGYKVSILEGKKSIDIVQAVVENHFDH